MGIWTASSPTESAATQAAARPTARTTTIVARQCECVPDATPLERADHRPGGEGDEETEHHRDDERRHLAEGEHRDEDEHEPADGRERTGGPHQPVRAGLIVAAIPNDTAARTFYVAPGHLGPP